jgi:uncharacterized protein (UPF0248 family)
MLPIAQLLNRIRWDRDFGAGYFEISYTDHAEAEDVRVPFRYVSFPPGDHFAFQVHAPDGTERTIPLHRVRAVYKNGTCIWQRSAPVEQESSAHE